MISDQLTSLAKIAELIAAGAQSAERRLVAMAGPPGAGKSTLAAALAALLNQLTEQCAVVPMDGFHFDNAILVRRGLLSRKGSPASFDTSGLRSILQRLRSDDEVAIPIFDRKADISRSAAFIIEAHHRILLVEGNYLLLDRQPWASIRPLYDVSIMIHAPRSTLKHRLIARWLQYGLARDEAETRAESNDLVNADDILNHSLHADFTLTNDG